jgi:hypothetical protein
VGRPLLMSSSPTFARNFTLLLRRHRSKATALLALSVHDPTLCDIIHSSTLGVAAIPASPQHHHWWAAWFGRGVLDGSRFRFVAWSVGRRFRFFPVVFLGEVGFVVIPVRLYARFLRHFSLPPGCSIKRHAIPTRYKTAEFGRKLLKNCPHILARAVGETPRIGMNHYTTTPNITHEIGVAWNIGDCHCCLHRPLSLWANAPPLRTLLVASAVKLVALPS